MGFLSKDELVAGLIMAGSEAEGIPVHAAYSLALDMEKFNEMAVGFAKQIRKSRSSKVFWDELPEQLSSQHLNDIEAFVYGMMIMATLLKMGGSVIWGKEAAEKNGIDYEKFMGEVVLVDLESGVES